MMRISSSGGAQPAAIQMNGAADNSANSSRAIILHASGPKDYFSYRTKSCSLTISCCRSPLPSAVPIICWQQLVSSVRQSVGLLTSLQGPNRVISGPAGAELQLRLRGIDSFSAVFILRHYRRVWTLRRDLSRRCCRCRPTHLNHNISPATPTLRISETSFSDKHCLC